jgi:hypothetical protein
MGYSIGAFESLFIAANAQTNGALIQFDRYVAIDTPVRLLYAVGKLDGFYEAPLAWPAQERSAKLENTFLKVAALAKSTPGEQAALSSLPFDAVESKFLVGMAFRLILRDVIFSSQQRTNMGILRTPIRKSRRYGSPRLTAFMRRTRYLPPMPVSMSWLRSRWRSRSKKLRI